MENKNIPKLFDRQKKQLIKAISLCFGESSKIMLSRPEIEYRFFHVLSSVKIRFKSLEKINDVVAVRYDISVDGTPFQERLDSIDLFSMDEISEIIDKM